MSRLRRKPWTKSYLQEQKHVIFDGHRWQGKWHSYFGNEGPLHVELGMGKGTFIKEMSLRHPNINFIGIDRYDELLRIASMNAVSEETGQAPPNLALMLADVDHIEEWFAPQEVERIYLNFSDPWPKKRHIKRRLTHPERLRKYLRVLAEGGEIHMRTDSSILFEYSLNAFLEEKDFALRHISLDVHREGTPDDYIFTEYERKFVEQGLPIYRLVAQKQ